MEKYLVVSLILVSSFSLQRSYSAAESGLQFKLSSGEENFLRAHIRAAIAAVVARKFPACPYTSSYRFFMHRMLILRSEDGLEGEPLHQQPSEIPKSIPYDKSAEEQTTQVIPDEMEIKLAEQTFKSEVGTCSEGMIPILRNQRPIRRTRGTFRQGVDSSHGHFQRKFTVNASETDPTDLHATATHEYALGSFSPSDALFRGAKGYFNVWKPSVELSSEFSSSQLWIIAGKDDQMNTIEVGWQHKFTLWGVSQAEPETYKVYKDRHKDNFPHLFIRWTDRGIDAWWLNVNGQFVGYWPNSLFTILKGGAFRVDWGGDILNSETGGRHTQTDMGSGDFPQFTWQRAAFIRSLQTVTSTPEQVFVDVPMGAIKGIYDNGRCYKVAIFDDSSSPSDWRTFLYFLYFGGPGYSNICPT